MNPRRKKAILVVGAGLSGATVARFLAERGWPVVVMEKKDHVAGHCYDYIDENGIRIHKYGPHIFHTSNEKVFAWLSRFTEWVDYEHCVVARLANGEHVPFPPNRETLAKVKQEDLVEVFYRPYSEKMWGMPLEALNAKILNRVPVRQDEERRYFPSEVYQKLPRQGYTRLVENMLSHAGITLRLGVAFEPEMASGFFHTFNSMPIDEFFGYRYGELPYRSLKFHHQVYARARKTQHPQVNFTDRSCFTRETEWKNFPGHGSNEKVTVVTKEQPCDYRENNMERYYPVNDAAGVNRALYKRYRQRVPDDMTFIGRCGLYVYLDMHQAVGSALATAEGFQAAVTRGAGRPAPAEEGEALCG